MSTCIINEKYFVFTLRKQANVRYGAINEVQNPFELLNLSKFFLNFKIIPAKNDIY